ncbi:MAG: T9SS type A sorting domain-containing protein [Bacteroidales bacterium]|nr:T9SS type A sorting domain-containing protein [Bacteroidales bacterium]
MKTVKYMLTTTLVWAMNLLIAQPWSVNPNDFQFSMNMSGYVALDAQTTSQQNAYLGAFVDEDCVGVCQPTDLDGTYQLYQITIYSNASSGDAIFFKWMDESSNLTEIDNFVLFSNNLIIGNVDHPFLWMSPVSYSSADILSFELDSQVTQAVIDAAAKSISLKVTKNTDLSSIIADFTISPGAIAKIGSVEQISGETINDYTNTVHYMLTGVDGLVNDWAVTLSFDDSGVEELNKSDWQIYPNPAIDFVFIKRIHESPIPNEAIEIYNITGQLEKIFILNKTTNNIKIDISDLKRGSYFVKIDNTTQRLIIL